MRVIIPHTPRYWARGRDSHGRRNLASQNWRGSVSTSTTGPRLLRKRVCWSVRPPVAWFCYILDLRVFQIKPFELLVFGSYRSRIIQMLMSHWNHGRYAKWPAWTTTSLKASANPYKMRCCPYTWHRIVVLDLCVAAVQGNIQVLGWPWTCPTRPRCGSNTKTTGTYNIGPRTVVAYVLCCQIVVASDPPNPVRVERLKSLFTDRQFSICVAKVRASSCQKEGRSSLD